MVGYKCYSWRWLRDSKNRRFYYQTNLLLTKEEIKEVKKMAENEKKTEKKKLFNKTSNSWLNVSGKAVFITVDPSDLEIAKNEYKGNERYSFCVPVSLVKDAISGQTGGILLSCLEY